MLHTAKRSGRCYLAKHHTVFTLCIQTERHELKFQIQTELFLKQQFDQVKHCLPFGHSILDTSHGNEMLNI